MSTPTKILIDLRTAAPMLSVSERTLWTLTKAGKVPCVRFGRLVRYNPDELLAFVKSESAKSVVSLEPSKN